MGAVVVPVSARSRPQWAIGELALVSAAAQRARVEVLHSMANFAPAWGRFRRVVTIHDLQYRAVPELLSWPTRAATSALVSLGARAADRIIAVSASGSGGDRRRPGGRARTDRRRPERRASCAAGPRDRRRARTPSARAASGRAGRRDQPPPQEPPGADRCARADRSGATPGAGDRRSRHRRRSTSDARCRRRGRRGLAPARRTHDPGARLAVRARRLPGAANLARGLRTARARGDGAICPCRLLGHPGAARGGRRRGAVFRPARTGADRRADHRSARRDRRRRTCASWAVLVPPASAGRLPRARQSRAIAERWTVDARRHRT